MNTQEVFNTVVNHLRKQGCKAKGHSLSEYEDNEICAYRGMGGNKCAVGCLIKDEFYSPSLEGKAIGHYEVKDAVRKSIGDFDSKTEWVLGKLQSIHDVQKPEDWEEDFVDAAEFFKLEMPHANA